MDAVFTVNAVWANTHTEPVVNKQVVKWEFREKRVSVRESRTAIECEGEKD